MEDYTCKSGDPDCEGALAPVNRPCCDECAEKYRSLVQAGKITDYVNSEGLADDVEVHLGIQERAPN